jgi:hypothetical protein
MAVTATPIFPQSVKPNGAQILPADTTTKKTIVTAGANGTLISALNITSTDTSARDIQLWFFNGSVDQLLCTISIPITAGGTNAIPSVAPFQSSQCPAMPYDANGNRVMYLGSGQSLKIAATTTVTAAKQIDAIAWAGDF